MEVIISDLDGTLTESKMKVSPEMSRAIERATRLYHFAVVSGGSFSQFKKQLVNGISNERQYLSKILLFPTNGTKLYRYVDDKWIKVYSMNLKVKDRKTIVEGFTRMIGEYELAKPNIIYGPQVEDRISQVTFSALGQFAPLSQKMEVTESWSILLVVDATNFLQDYRYLWDRYYKFPAVLCKGLFLILDFAYELIWKYK